MNNLMLKVILYILAGLLSGCATYTNIAPVGKGNTTANFSIGGPIISAYHNNIPVPYATIGANHGIAEDVNISATLHLLSLPYKVFGLEIGAAWFPVINTGAIPTIGIQPKVMVLASLKHRVETRYRFYPIISCSAAWQTGGGHFYTGFDFVRPFSSSDYDEDAPRFILSPFVGYRWKIGEKTGLLTEAKWHGSNIRTDQLVVEYLPVQHYGAITTLIAVERSF